MNLLAILLAFCISGVSVTGLLEITINAIVMVYDDSPRIRLQCRWLETTMNLLWKLRTSSNEILLSSKDFSVESKGDEVTLQLSTRHKWASISASNNGSATQSLTVFSITDLSTPTEELLERPSTIAYVVARPTVFVNSNSIYANGNELRILGDGFIGARKVDLYFVPPLFRHLDYELVTPVPPTSNEVVLRLRHGYLWRQAAGPLSVSFVDTGAGISQVGEDGQGVVVANVLQEVVASPVSVESNPGLRIYHTDPEITVTGTGFTSEMTLRFANGLIQGLNFTIRDVTETSCTIRLEAGSAWRRSLENLPATLTLLAVNPGSGFVAVGPINSWKGVDVALVLERPSIQVGFVHLYQTRTPELHISGSGFVPNSTALNFGLASLRENIDYTLTVLSRTEVFLRLLPGRSWMRRAGALCVSAVNTKGVGVAGWARFPDPGIKVATVELDSVGVGDSVVIFPDEISMYQRILNQSIEITGMNFNPQMKLTLNNELIQGIGFELTVASPTSAKISLRDGFLWMPTYRISKWQLQVTSVDLNGHVESFVKKGVQIASILPDPVIYSSEKMYYNSQSVAFPIRGSGFTNLAIVDVDIYPTSRSSYTIKADYSTLKLNLKPGMTWAMRPLISPDDKIKIMVTAIDIGGGKIQLSPPIVVGYVVADNAAIVCDDSCIFSLDGVCDDGSMLTESSNYYSEGEHTFGGYYNDDGSSSSSSSSEDKDDYYTGDDGQRVSACALGTDCTDCGGVQPQNPPLSPSDQPRTPSTRPTAAPYPRPLIPGQSPTRAPTASRNAPPNRNRGGEGCQGCCNTCAFARDGICDDPRGGWSSCALGTDCQDCGPLGADNFTKVIITDDVVKGTDDHFFDQNRGADRTSRDWLYKYRRKQIDKIISHDNPLHRSGYLILNAVIIGLSVLLAVAMTVAVMLWLKNGRTCRGLCSLRRLRELSSSLVGESTGGNTWYDLVPPSEVELGDLADNKSS